MAKLIAALVLSFALHVAIVALVQVEPSATHRQASRLTLKVRVVDQREPLSTVHLSQEVPSRHEVPASGASEGEKPEKPAQPQREIVQPRPVTIELAAVSQTHFFEPREVDTRAEVLTPFEPANLFVGTVLSGRAIVELAIDADGKLARLSLRDVSDPTGKVATLLERFFTEATYSPAMKNGQRVASFKRIEITFEQELLEESVR